MEFSIQKGICREVEGNSRVEETGYRQETEEMKLHLFHIGEYLGSVFLRQIKGGVELYIPSVPESVMTRLGKSQVKLDFGGKDGSVVTQIPIAGPSYPVREVFQSTELMGD